MLLLRPRSPSSPLAASGVPRMPSSGSDGVVDAESGYTGGHTEDPTYQEVCSHTTGHAEAVRVIYNPDELGA